MEPRGSEDRDRLAARRRIAAIQATAEEEWWRSVKSNIDSRREAGLRSEKWSGKAPADRHDRPGDAG